jgi:hypothetical protein
MSAHFGDMWRARLPYCVDELGDADILAPGQSANSLSITVAIAISHKICKILRDLREILLRSLVN